MHNLKIDLPPDPGPVSTISAGRGESEKSGLFTAAKIEVACGRSQPIARDKAGPEGAVACCVQPLGSAGAGAGALVRSQIYSAVAR